MKSTKIKHEFITLRSKGLSFTKISNKLNISRQTLIDWANEFENEIANLKAAELEELVDTYYLNKKSRLETLGTLMKKLKSELLNRDFTTVNTDKLLDLFIKYDNQIKEEYTQSIYKTTLEIKEEGMIKELLKNLVTDSSKVLKVG